MPPIIGLASYPFFRHPLKHTSRVRCLPFTGRIILRQIILFSLLNDIAHQARPHRAHRAHSYPEPRAISKCEVLSPPPPARSQIIETNLYLCLFSPLRNRFATLLALHTPMFEWIDTAQNMLYICSISIQRFVVAFLPLCTELHTSLSQKRTKAKLKCA